MPRLTAQSLTVAKPEVTPFAGDPRLEPIPSSPIHVPNFTVFGEGRQLRLRFPPRVNGQNVSDGDLHADLFAFFDMDTGLPIPGQLPVVEAVPRGAAERVSELDARKYSAIWEMHAVMVVPWYDPNDPAQRIDTVAEIFGSPLVNEVYQTNIFLNCPVLPNGSTVDPGSLPLEEAWYNGSVVTLAPYDVEDGVSHPQVLFRFANHVGHTLPSETAPHLVLSRLPGMPFYSSIWEVWTVTVPTGFDVTQLTSVADVKNSGFPITAGKVRLNCPVIAVEDAPGAGTFTQMPFENAFDLMRNDFSQGVARFNPSNFFIDVPDGTHVEFTYDGSGQPIGRSFAPSLFHKQRGFRLTEKVGNGGGGAGLGLPLEPEPPLTGLASRFPQVAGVKGNFIPLILQRPFPMTSPAWWPRVSAPDSTGELARFSQQELDDAYLNNDPPLLPFQVEKNFEDFIQHGLMDPSWAPGQRPYMERLALVGRAFHEFVWQPEHGIEAIDVTSCVACHATPTAGAGGRQLYAVQPRFGDPLHGTILDTVNSSSMWGSAAAELIVQDRRGRGLPATEPHASTGDRDTIRHFASKAQNAHFGVQSVENIVEQVGGDTRTAQNLDQDGDGVLNEVTVGEITAQAAFLLSLPVPNELNDKKLRMLLGVTDRSVSNGKSLFRRAVSRGGAGCVSCHTPFIPLHTTTMALTNPETTMSYPIQVSHHLATAEDVADGWAAMVGQPGARIYGDFRFHKMGSLMRSIGVNAPDVFKTSELWDVGSTAPYLRDGSAGMDLHQAIARHSGVTRTEVSVARGPWTVLSATERQQTVTLTNNGTETIPGSVSAPIRLVLVGLVLPGTALAQNADGRAPDGSRREGSFWNVEQPLAPGESVSVDLVFQSNANVTYELLVQDFDGFSEAAASAHAFLRLSSRDQGAMVDFLKVQVINGQVGEGSGGIDAKLRKQKVVEVGGDLHDETETEFRMAR
ncbi:MAG: hypothetical protein AB7O97_15720 [Planctomycetota bacterium]